MRWVREEVRAEDRRIVYELVLYFVLAYAMSAVLWLPALLSTGRLSRVCLPIGTIGPTVAAVITSKILGRSWRTVRVWSTLRQIAIGIACGSSAVLMAAFTAAFLMTKSGADRWQWSSLLLIVTMFGPNLLGGPLGEEAGWRGYALVRLQRRLNPTTASVLLGFLWANWHLPLFAAHVYNVTWWQYVLVTIAASVYLTLAFNISGGSTCCAIIVQDFIAKAQLYRNAVQHQIFWATYLGVAAVLCGLTKGRLGYRRMAIIS
jgi:membrane protease YdiL (CAAX protease family)